MNLKKNEKNSSSIIKDIKSGKIYAELEKRFKIKKTELNRQRKKNKQIDELYALIKKKEQELERNFSSIVKLKNKLSDLIHKQLEEKS